MNEQDARMRHYEHRLRQGRKVEMECQTYASTSDVQTQNAPETKDSSSQTMYNYRFYMDYPRDDDDEEEEA